jgi:predicted MFS family arabinose efflux permease
MLSDRIGRKPVIAFGLLLFAGGSWLAGATHDIQWIILGRALQGAGAVSGAVSALLADSTRLSIRTSAMTIMGIGMGLSFILALVIGPIVAGIIGVDGIFTMTGWLALAAIPLVIFALPSPSAAANSPAQPALLRSVLRDSQLLRLDGGIFLLHAMMTALFIAAPHAIEETLGLPNSQHWHVYLPVLLLSIVPVFPLLQIVEKRQLGKPGLLIAVGALGFALLLAAETHASAVGLCGSLFLFFMALNYLEGALPSMISRRAPIQQKGAALGIYSSSQFLGGFAGAKLGGYALEHWHIGGVFAVAAVLSALWLSFAVGIAPITHQPEGDETAAI